MINVTPGFQEAIKAPARRIVSRVKINFTDLFLDPTATAVLEAIDLVSQAGDLLVSQTDDQIETQDNKAEGSFEDQIANGRRGATRKWAAMDGVTIMDGSYFYAPGDADLASFNEIGWWGNLLADVNGDFSYPQIVSVIFSPRNISRMDLTADDKRNEYPVDFQYEFFDGALLSLGIYLVTGNGTALRSDTVDFTGVEKITLTITKWSTPGTNAKITEMSSVLEQVYEGDAVENLQITEQREISNNNSIPTGNIAASETSVSLVNIGRQFDANNVDSPLFGSVRPGSRVRIEIGVYKADQTVEYVPVFSGWSVAWSAPEKSINAVTTARDRLDLLTRTEITAGAVEVDKTFGYWFEMVLNDAALSSSEYEIDAVLFTIEYLVPYGWLDKQTHRAALELIATGCAGTVFQDRLGIIQIQAIDYLNRNNITSVENYDSSDYMDKDNQPVYENLANRVIVSTAPRVPAASSTVYETAASEPEEIGPSTVENFTISYDDTPVLNGAATITPAVGGVTITGETYYSWGAVLEVTNANGTGQQFNLEVTGQVLEVRGRQIITAINEESISDNGEYAFTLPDNQFLQRKSLAIDIADGLIDSFSDPQRDLTVNFSPGGSPAIEMGDKIGVTDKYSEKEYNIISTKMSFDGGLSLQHKGRIVKQNSAIANQDGLVMCSQIGDTLITSQVVTFQLMAAQNGDTLVTQSNNDVSSRRTEV